MKMNINDNVQLVKLISILMDRIDQIENDLQMERNNKYEVEMRYQRVCRECAELKERKKK